MNTILIFVVLPLATIIFSIALQRILKCSILVALVIFAIFLILTYTVLGTDFLIFAILFAILAFITAFLTCLVCKIIRRLQTLDDENSNNEDSNTNNCCGCSSALLSTSNNNGNSNCGCGCSCNNRVLLDSGVTDDSGDNRTRSFRGGYRRRY